MTERRKPGRPTLYTSDRIKIILDAISIGAKESDACVLADISQEVFCLWKKTKPEFLQQVTRARAKGKITRIAKIQKAGDEDWRALAWLLERMNPEEFAQRLIVKITSEQAQLLEKHGLTAAQAFELFFQELAAADAS